MATEILQKSGNPISFADHAGDFGPTAAYVIEHDTPTDVQLSLASVAAAASRQSAQADLGATRAAAYAIHVCLEVASGASVSLETVDFYWNASPNSTAANGNSGGCTGGDAAYSGTAQDSLSDSLKQLIYLGSHVATTDDTADGVPVQISQINSNSLFYPPTRYGSLVVVNNLTGAFHSDDVEMAVVFSPVIDESQ
jgi:hypothetical protein